MAVRTLDQVSRPGIGLSHHGDRTNESQSIAPIT